MNGRSNRALALTIGGMIVGVVVVAVIVSCAQPKQKVFAKPPILENVEIHKVPGFKVWRMVNREYDTLCYITQEAIDCDPLEGR